MYKIKVNERTLEVTLNNDQVQLDGHPFHWDISNINDRSYHIIKDNKSYRAEVLSIDALKKSITLKINGNRFDIQLKDKLDLLLEKLGMDTEASAKITEIKAPMPGLILDIQIAEGDKVAKGDPIMILEAMKMENVIKAEGSGVVKSIKVKKGDSVEKNQVLVQF